METDAQRHANLAYRKKSTKQLNITLYPTDVDIIDWLRGVKNKAAYVKGLIRDDIEKSAAPIEQKRIHQC